MAFIAILHNPNKVRPIGISATITLFNPVVNTMDNSFRVNVLVCCDWGRASWNIHCAFHQKMVISSPSSLIKVPDRNLCWSSLIGETARRLPLSSYTEDMVRTKKKQYHPPPCPAPLYSQAQCYTSHWSLIQEETSDDVRITQSPYLCSGFASLLTKVLLRLRLSAHPNPKP